MRRLWHFIKLMAVIAWEVYRYPNYNSSIDRATLRVTRERAKGVTTPSLTRERLISASQEMFDALKAYVAAKPQCECGGNSGCSMAKARQTAMQLIARIEGNL